MRKLTLAFAVLTLVCVIGGCRSVSGALWKIPEWIGGKVLNVYTGNGHYDGKARWDNYTNNHQQVQNFVDIYFFNYDIRDPYVGTPFFGDPH
jgi:hypothetical protein